jgi:hypothetical protein
MLTSGKITELYVGKGSTERLVHELFMFGDRVVYINSDSGLYFTYLHESSIFWATSGFLDVGELLLDRSPDGIGANSFLLDSNIS